ncbi:MATE efflux family protein 7 [Apostasia shenzhenica]|uniref:MATE efflux family protein 7 n=1 Tax=Apostasia shenzhenica TaxID=1088818 RepID=A0A2I0AC26_9ASPA|nr:MATE efflux family protein 7 [Apostasia shenzhenica]
MKQGSISLFQAHPFCHVGEEVPLSDPSGQSLEDDLLAGNGETHLMPEPKLLFRQLKEEPELRSRQNRDGEDEPPVVLPHVDGEVPLRHVHRRLLAGVSFPESRVPPQYLFSAAAGGSLASSMDELKKQRAIILPLIPMNSTWFAKTAITTAFLGRIGELELAAGTLALTFANVTGFSILNGLSWAMEPICGQAHVRRPKPPPPPPNSPHDHRPPPGDELPHLPALALR